LEATRPRPTLPRSRSNISSAQGQFQYPELIEASAAMADSPPKRKQTFEEYLKTQSSEIERRKNLFGVLNRFVARHGGWITSVPGSRTVRIEILKNSALAGSARRSRLPSAALRN
jgi:hypothetical protein